jgi:Transcriptional regulator, AbiEi antitoxin
MGSVHDGSLLRLANRQHGLVAMRQLAAPGYTENHIRRRIEATVLFRVYRGVYAVTGCRDTFEFRVMAAVYGFRRIDCDRPAITVCRASLPQFKGVEWHRRATLTARHRARVGAIPVTSPAWTLLDLAGVFDVDDPAQRSRLGGAIDDVLVRKLASLSSIERLLERFAGRRRPGIAVVRELVAERRDGKKPSETGLEDELLEIFRVYGLPEPVRQYVLRLPSGGTARFDAAYPELLLGFEADGDAHHTGHAADPAAGRMITLPVTQGRSLRIVS